MLLVLLLFSQSASWAQQPDAAERDAFRAEIDQWLAPHRTEKREVFGQWFAEIQQAPQRGFDHPFYQHLKQFVDEHQDTYTRLRLASLRSYPAAPPQLPGYTPIDIAELLGDKDSLEYMLYYIQEISSIRTLDAGDTRSSISALSSSLFVYLNKELGMSLVDIADGYASGNLLFADEIDDRHWKITLVNRLHAIRYRWNIHTNRIDGPEVLIYTDSDRQEAGWLAGYTLVAETPRLRLLNKIWAFRWERYDLQAGRYALGGVWDTNTQEFINSHRAAYTAVREESLSKFVEPPANWLEGYVPENTGFVDELKYSIGVVHGEETDKLLPQVALVELSPYGELFNLFVFHSARHQGDAASNDTLIGWIAGYDIYARNLGENEWEVTGFSGSYALQYRWNIATDEIDGFTCWRKE